MINYFMLSCEWVYYSPTTPYKYEFMMVWKKYIDAYRAQQQGYGHPLTIIMSRKVRKKEKPHGENPPSRLDKAQNLKYVFNIYSLSL